MTGDDGVCRDHPPRNAPDQVMHCREIQCGPLFLAAINIVKLITMYRQK